MKGDRVRPRRRLGAAARQRLDFTVSEHGFVRPHAVRGRVEHDLRRPVRLPEHYQPLVAGPPRRFRERSPGVVDPAVDGAANRESDRLRRTPDGVGGRAGLALEQRVADHEDRIAPRQQNPETAVEHLRHVRAELVEAGTVPLVAQMR